MTIDQLPQADPLGLRELLQPLLERYDQAVEERLEHLAGLQRTEAGIVQFHDILVRAGFDVELPEGLAQAQAEGPKAKKKKSSGRVGVTRANGTSTGYGISMEAGAQMAKVVLQLVDERQAEVGPGKPVFVTQKEIYTAVGTDQGKGSAAFRWFRHIGFVGKQGRDPGSTRERWKVMDRTAVDRALQEASRAADAEFHQLEGSDPVARALEYIETEGTVKGWATILRACDIPEGHLETLKPKIIGTGKVDLVSKPGAASIITWKGSSNGQ